MAARYQLLAVGVRDHQEQIDIGQHSPGWPAYQDWLAAGNTPDVQTAIVEPLAVRQDRAWSRIKERREAIKRGGVLVSGKWFHTDDASRVQQLGLVLMGASVPAVSWKTLDGTSITMTAPIATGIFQAVAALDMAAHATAETNKAALLAAPDPDAYDFSAGWPAIYQET